MTAANQKQYDNHYQQPNHHHKNNVSPSQQMLPQVNKKHLDGMEYIKPNRHKELIMQEQSGYGSDGSETLSANSAQSMQKR